MNTARNRRNWRSTETLSGPPSTTRGSPPYIPPFAQMVHALFYLGFGSVAGFKLAFLGVEIGLVAAILALLRRSGRPLGRVLVYAWNPLVVVEVAWNGHHDVLVVGLLLWALFLLQIRSRAAAMGVLAAAVLSKLYPLLLAPAFLRGTSGPLLGMAGRVPAGDAAALPGRRKPASGGLEPLPPPVAFQRIPPFLAERPGALSDLGGGPVGGPGF